MTNMTIEEYIKKVNKSYKAPKCKKVSAYNMYCKESRKGKEGSLGEVMTKLGADWKGLDEKNKEKWTKKAEKENKKLTEEFGEGPEQDLLVVELAKLLKKTISDWKKEVKKRETECEEEYEEECDEEECEEEAED
jgi:hypothetical protein